MKVGLISLGCAKNLVDSHQYQRKLAKQNRALESTLEQLKETETQLVQTEKMASLGRLSAGIIHEINNPLNFATTGLFTLRRKGSFLAPEQRPEYEEILKDIEEGLSRVTHIVSDLRAFSTNGNDHRDELNVKEAVTSALSAADVAVKAFLSQRSSVRALVQAAMEAMPVVGTNNVRCIDGGPGFNQAGGPLPVRNIVVTKGAEGAVIYAEGKEIVVPVTPDARRFSIHSLGRECSYLSVLYPTLLDTARCDPV